MKKAGPGGGGGGETGRGDEGKGDDMNQAVSKPGPRPKIRGGTHNAKLGPELQEYIGRELQSIYSDVLSQPVPDRFLDLLKKLDSKKAGE